ncbi:MAG: hypothetical protein WC426_11245 [Sulfuriferula sp.]
MKSLIRQTKSGSFKVVMALTFVSLISSLSISPALADRHDNHGRGDRHGNYGHGESRDYRGEHGYRHEHQRYYGYEQRGYYERPVYVPPPVYYEPRQSAGVSIFFPIDLRR